MNNNCHNSSNRLPLIMSTHKPCKLIKLIWYVKNRSCKWCFHESTFCCEHANIALLNVKQLNRGSFYSKKTHMNNNCHNSSTYLPLIMSTHKPCKLIKLLWYVIKRSGKWYVHESTFCCEHANSALLNVKRLIRGNLIKRVHMNNNCYN